MIPKASEVLKVKARSLRSSLDGGQSRRTGAVFPDRPPRWRRSPLRAGNARSLPAAPGSGAGPRRGTSGRWNQRRSRPCAMSASISSDVPGGMIAARCAVERLQPSLRTLRQVSAPPAIGQTGLVFQLFGSLCHEPADLRDHLPVRGAAGGSETRVQGLGKVDAQPLDRLGLRDRATGSCTHSFSHLPSPRLREGAPDLAAAGGHRFGAASSGWCMGSSSSVGAHRPGTNDATHHERRSVRPRGAQVHYERIELGSGSTMRAVPLHFDCSSDESRCKCADTSNLSSKQAQLVEPARAGRRLLVGRRERTARSTERGRRRCAVCLFVAAPAAGSGTAPGSGARGRRPVRGARSCGGRTRRAPPRRRR